MRPGSQRVRDSQQAPLLPKNLPAQGKAVRPRSQFYGSVDRNNVVGSDGSTDTPTSWTQEMARQRAELVAEAPSAATLQAWQRQIAGRKFPQETELQERKSEGTKAELPLATTNQPPVIIESFFAILPSWKQALSVFIGFSASGLAFLSQWPGIAASINSIINHTENEHAHPSPAVITAAVIATIPNFLLSGWSAGRLVDWILRDFYSFGRMLRRTNFAPFKIACLFLAAINSMTIAFLNSGQWYWMIGAGISSLMNNSNFFLVRWGHQATKDAALTQAKALQVNGAANFALDDWDKEILAIPERMSWTTEQYLHVSRHIVCQDAVEGEQDNPVNNSRSWSLEAIVSGASTLGALLYVASGAKSVCIFTRYFFERAHNLDKVKAVCAVNTVPKLFENWRKVLGLVLVGGPSSTVNAIIFYSATGGFFSHWGQYSERKIALIGAIVFTLSGMVYNGMTSFNDPLFGESGQWFAFLQTAVTAILPVLASYFGNYNGIKSLLSTGKPTVSHLAGIKPGTEQQRLVEMWAKHTEIIPAPIAKELLDHASQLKFGAASA